MPPWIDNLSKINLEIHEHQKSSTSSNIHRLLFLEAIEKYEDHKFIYTDSSVIEDKAGYAIVSENNTYSYKLPEGPSIFTCEATAILRALELLETIENF